MKKIITLSLILSILFLTSCTKDEIKIQKEYKTSIVETGSLSNNETYVGYIKSDNELNIAPKVGGKVVLLNKEVGDKVKSGELIAKVDGSEANASYNSSNEIINSLEKLKTSTQNSYDKQIESNEQKIDQLKKSIEMAEINIQTASSGVEDTLSITDSQIQTVKNQITQAQIGLETANLNYSNTKTTLEQQEKDLYTNGNTAINNAINLGNNIIDYFDNIYGVTQKNKKNNDSFEDYLSIKDTKYLTQSEDQLSEIIKKYEHLKDYENSTDKETVLDYLNNFYDLFNNDITEFLNTSYKVMENTISSNYLNTSAISEIKTYITNFQTNNQNLILSVSGNYIVGLKGSIDNINNFENQKNQNIDMLQKQIDAAKNQIEILNETLKTYEAQKKSSETQVSSSLEQAKKQKELLESQLNEAKLGIEAIKEQSKASIDEINTQIAQVKSGKTTSAIMIENSKVYANFDGIITKKYVEVGQVIGAGNPVYQINGDGNLEIEILVGEESEKNINIGDNVNIEIDGVDNIINGKVKNIYPSKDQITKKTTVEIFIEKNNQIKIGSYAKASFINNTGNSGIIIPNSAIIQKYLVPGVYVVQKKDKIYKIDKNGNKIFLENNQKNIEENISKGVYVETSKKAIFKKIEIINQSNNFSQINGLDVGETIITDGKENIYDGEILN